MTIEIKKAPEPLRQLVAETDTGGRQPTGLTAGVIFTASLAWSDTRSCQPP